MISCPKCGKENQDHYKFCLGCGNELPRDGQGARPFQPTPPAGVPSAAGARPAGNAPAAPPAPAPFGGAPPGPPAPSPFGGPPGPSPFGGAPPGPPAPAPFGGAPPGPPAPLGSAGPFGGAPIPASISSPPPPVGAPASAGPKPAATCPQCGTPNTRGARFCLTCGNDLSVASMPAPAPAPVAERPAPAPAPAPAPFGGSAPAAASQPVGTRPSAVRLVLIRPDGSEGGTFQLNEGITPVGRDAGGLFAGDSYLSPRHATFTVNGQTVSVRDENSLNGVYIRIERQAPVEIRDTEIFRIGQEILRYDAYKPVAPESDGTEKQGAQIEGLVGKISLMIGRETYGNAFPIPVTGLFLGRERGDILFPEDGYVSGLHCQISVEGGKVMLTDVGSSNGSYVRARGERTVRNGDLLLIGQQLFRITM